MAGVKQVVAGTSVPEALKYVPGKRMVVVLPSHTPLDLQTLQEAEPILKSILGCWEKPVCPTPEERRQLKPSLVLLKQWDCLTKKDGVLHRIFLLSDVGEQILKVVLQGCLQSHISMQFHQEHGHQDVQQNWYMNAVAGQG